MWEWLQDNGWAAWTAVAIGLATIETFSLDLIFIMLAGGAAAGALSAALGAPFVVAALIALASSAALLGVVRPVARRHLRQPLTARTGVEALIGRQGEVLEQVDGIGGQIKLGGEIWSARSYDGSAVIEPGARVDIIEISGATALVFPAES